MKLSKKLTVGKTLIYLIVTLVALICLLPLVFFLPARAVAGSV